MFVMIGGTCMQGLESVVIEQAVQLIIIDSIAMLARAEFGGQQIQDRQSHLGESFLRPRACSSLLHELSTHIEPLTDRHTSACL